MSLLDRFRQEWAAHFPSNAAPQLACLIPSIVRPTFVNSPTTSGSTKIKTGKAVQQAVAAWEAVTVTSATPVKSGGSVGSQPDGRRNSSAAAALNREAVERTMRTFESNVERLERELEQHRFVVRFLNNILGVVTDDKTAVTASLIPVQTPNVSASSDVDRGGADRMGGSMSADRHRSKSTPLLPISTAAAEAAEASQWKPIPPVRLRRKAVRDRNLSQADPPLNSDPKLSNWRTSVYEEVIPYDPSLHQHHYLERHIDGGRRQSSSLSSSSSSSLSSRSDSSSANSYIVSRFDDDEERVTGSEDAQTRRPSGPLMRTGREAMRGRMRTWHTLFDDGNDEDKDADQDEAGIIRTPLSGGRRFSVVPRMRPSSDDDENNADDDADVRVDDRETLVSVVRSSSKSEIGRPTFHRQFCF